MFRGGWGGEEGTKLTGEVGEGFGCAEGGEGAGSPRESLWVKAGVSPGGLTVQGGQWWEPYRVDSGRDLRRLFPGLQHSVCDGGGSFGDSGPGAGPRAEFLTH